MKRYAPSDYMINVDDESTHVSKSELYVAVEDLPRWIPVSERLPEENVSVLVFTKDGKFDRAGMHVAILDEDGEWYPSHGDGYMFPVVTHWMPLPEPPNDPTHLRDGHNSP